MHRAGRAGAVGLALLALLVTLAATGCSSAPKRPAADGAGAALSTQDAARLPDAEPRVEPIRSGGPNKPYVVAGENIVPLTTDAPLVQTGLASWYGRAFQGRRTASGERFDMHALTAAHRTMPLPSYARVRNPANGREIIVRVNDRGPFVKGRIIDLSWAAAAKLGLLRGVAPVEVERITNADIRAGRAVAQAAPPPRVPPPPLVQTPTIAVAQEASALPPASSAAGFWVQLGAFGKLDGAQGFLQRVEQEAPWLKEQMQIFSEQGLHRLQAGPYATREQAQQAAARARADLQLVPALMERR